MTFENCTSLNKITLSESLTTIGRSDFKNCGSLSSINIPDNVTNIGDNAFYGCTSLTSITLPNSITNIGATAFEECSSLETVIFKTNDTNANITCLNTINDQTFSDKVIEVKIIINGIDKLSFKKLISEGQNKIFLIRLDYGVINHTEISIYDQLKTALKK